MKKAIAKTAVTIAATLTSAALVYAAKDSVPTVAYLVFVTTVVFAGLAFAVDVES